MVAVASQPPIRTPSGGTTDQIFQPLADCGNGNPFFYHMFSDDLDQATSFNSTAGTGTYTVTAATGSWAQLSADGGAGRFTTGAVSGNFTGIQLPSPSFKVGLPKKMFFETQIISNSAPATTSIIVGLISTNATPFTAVADGIYFKWVGGTGLTINSAIGSVVTSVTIPASAYTFAAASQPLGLAFYVTRLGDVLAYVDTQLVGFIPQSNIGTTNNPQNAGAVARITAPSLTTALLAPLIFVQTNSAAAQTIDFDFLQAQKER